MLFNTTITGRSFTKTLLQIHFLCSFSHTSLVLDFGSPVDSAAPGLAAVSNCCHPAGCSLTILQAATAVQGSRFQLYIRDSGRPLPALSLVRLLLSMAARYRVSGIFGVTKYMSEKECGGFLGWYEQKKLKSDNCCESNAVSNQEVTLVTPNAKLIMLSHTCRSWPVKEEIIYFKLSIKTTEKYFSQFKF